MSASTLLKPDPPLTLHHSPVPLARVVETSPAVVDADALLSGGAAHLRAANSPVWILLDFGIETVGTVEFEVTAESDAELRVYYGEDIIEAKRDADFTGGWYHLPVDEWRLCTGRHHLQPSGRRAFRYIRVQVEQGAVDLKNVRATLVHYPVERRGSFGCSDAQLNRIWEISEHTTRLCMQHYFEDGVKRDGLLWIGDYRVQYLCAALLYGDVELARRSLRFIADSQFPDGRLPATAIRTGAHQHPTNINYMWDFSGDEVNESWMANWKLLNYDCDFVSAVREFWELSGDSETTAELWPAVARVVDALANIALDVPHSEFITDDQPDHDGWWKSRGALFLQRHQALRDAAFLAREFGEAEHVVRYDALLQQSASQCEVFYSSTHRTFLDENPANDATARVSWHANAFAVLSGIAKKEGRALLQAVASTPQACYAVAGFMEFYRLQATFDTGLTTEALEEIRRYWGHMLKFDATSCWDCCDPLRFPDGIERPNTHAMSHCHGWSAGPAYLLPTYVLGVRSVEPGFKRVSIEPQLGGLQWAEGIVPTPHGDIHVRWEQSQPLRGRVTLPAGVEGEVAVTDAFTRRSISLSAGDNIIA